MSRRYPGNRTPRGSWDLEKGALLAVILALGAWRFGGTTADPDLWGRLRFGLDRVRSGTYLFEDPYSYLTTGRTWHDHDWLTDNFMARTYEGLGASGLVVVKAALGLALTALLGWWLVRSGFRAIHMAALLAVSVLALTPTLGTFRPQILTAFLFTLALIIICQVHEGRTFMIWLFPPMFALWVNLHGGVLAGAAIVGLWALLFALDAANDHRFRPLLAWLIGLVALGLNPLGYDHVRFLIETTSVGRPEIVEWLPIQIVSPQGVAFLVLASFAAFMMWRRRDSIVWPVWIPLTGLTVAPLVAGRHLQLFVPAVVVLGSWIWSTAPAPEMDRVDADRPSAWRGWMAVMVVASLFLVAWVGNESQCLRVDSQQFAFPARAVDAIPEGTRGNAVVPFNWGEYLIWWRGTDIQVSTDGRRETIYSEEVHRMNLDFIDGIGDDWDRLLEAGPVDLMLLPTRSQASVSMGQDDEWVRAYSDDYATIFLPANSKLAIGSNPNIPIDGDGLCFPPDAPEWGA